MQTALVNYEHPAATANCGGGGEVTKQLAAGLRRRAHGVELVSGHGPHWAAFPATSARDAWAAARDADVVHGHFSLPSSLALPAIAARHDAPLLVSVMGADVYDPTRFGPIRPLADRANDYILSRADGVVAPSADMAARVRDKYGIDPEIIHYGIDPDDWDWSKRRLGSTVDCLAVCRQVSRKNLDAAVAAVQAVQSEGIRATLTLAGTGPEHDRLKREHGHYPWLRLPGYVEDLQACFDAHDVFVLPSHHEAFGMVFLEALACGLPVVTSDTGGQTDIVHSGVGAVAPPDDPAALADALQRVIAEYPPLQDATEGYVERWFTRDNMVDDYETLYQEVA